MKIVILILICFISANVLKAQKNDEPKNRKKNIEIIDNKDITFEFEKSSSVKLTDEMKVLLDDIIVYLKENKEPRLLITGYSYDQGTLQENQERSIKRAQNVADYLIFKGIDKERRLVSGMGAKEPIASNKTKEGRKKNSRVVIKISTIVYDIRR